MKLIRLHSLEYCQKHFACDNDGDFWYDDYELQCHYERRDSGTKHNFCFHKLDIGKTTVYSIWVIQDWMIERELNEIDDAEYFI